MSIFDQITALLDAGNARYRVIDHPAEGRSEAIAAIRGTAVGQGAKALVCRVRLTSSLRAHVLAVFPADQQADLARVAAAVGGKKAALADRELAEQLTGCPMGAVPPFSFDPELRLVVDPALASRYPEIAFNAGRLDRSIVLDTADYFRLVQPEQAPLCS